MERHGRRLTQLEKKQGYIQLQLGKLDLKENAVEESKSENGRSKDILRRDLTDVKIRIRNLDRNMRRELNEKVRLAKDDLSRQDFLAAGDIDLKEDLVAVLNNDEDDTKGVPDNMYIKGLKTKDNPAEHEDIDAEDDIFNPKSEQLNTTRPVVRLYPKVPLPHSRPNWDRMVRVGRMRDRPVVRMTDWEGQFTGVEEGERERSLKERELKRDRRQQFIDAKDTNLRGRENVQQVRQSDEKKSNSIKQFPANLLSSCKSSTRKVSTSVTPALAGNIIIKNFLSVEKTLLPALSYAASISPDTSIPNCKSFDLLLDKKLSDSLVPQEIFTKIKSKSIIVEESKLAEVVQEINPSVVGGHVMSPAAKVGPIKVNTVRPKLIVTHSRVVGKGCSPRGRFGDNMM